MNFKPIPNKFEYLNWQEIESIAKEKRSTVIWPFGAVEQHGPHLPLATDSIFVDEIISEVFKLFSADIPLKKLPTQYIGFSPEQVQAIAAEYTVIDGPDNEGNMFERPAKPSDRFVGPFANKQEARFNNNGSYPPDLSVIAKARKNGVDYLYNLLLGYTNPPESFEASEGMYFNQWIDGNQIAMAPPLGEGYVDYDDGTNNTLPQLAEDVVTFLEWSAEPELEERKSLGIKVILFFIVLGFIVFLAKRRLWKNIH